MNCDLVRKAGLEMYVVQGKTYPGVLPAGLRDSYCYTKDGGHSIIVVLENEYNPAEPVENFLAPAAVKTVLKNGYTIRDGYVWCNIPFDSLTGLQEDLDDMEF
jgi:hypothetical protein